MSRLLPVYAITGLLLACATTAPRSRFPGPDGTVLVSTAGPGSSREGYLLPILGERDVIRQILRLRKPGDVAGWWASGPGSNPNPWTQPLSRMETAYLEQMSAPSVPAPIRMWPPVDPEHLSPEQIQKAEALLGPGAETAQRYANFENRRRLVNHYVKTHPATIQLELGLYATSRDINPLHFALERGWQMASGQEMFTDREVSQLGAAAEFFLALASTVALDKAVSLGAGSPGEVSAGQARPPPPYGKVIALKRVRSSEQPLEVGEERLASTGTDGPPILLQSRSPAGDALVASLKRSGKGGNRAPSDERLPQSPGSSAGTAGSSPGRSVSGRVNADTAPRPTNAPGEREPGTLPASNDASPGRWNPDAKDSMSDEARGYQSEVTHQPPRTTYVMEGVEMPDGKMTNVSFDGYVPGKEFQECKGPGYNQFLDKERPGYFQWWFERSQLAEGGMVTQARRQLQAAKGILPVRWYVAEREAAEAIEALLHDHGARAVEVIYRPYHPTREAK